MVKRKLKLKKPKIHLFTVFVFLADLCVIAAFVVIYSPWFGFKDFWIPTAMTTMSHRYLAYTLYDEKTVDKVMSENYTKGVEEEVNLDDIVIDTNSENRHYTSKYEKEMFTKDPDNDVYKIIRLEEDNFKGYLTVIYDPADVDLAIPKRLGKAGQSVAKIKDGKLVWQHAGGSGGLIGFTKDHKMYLTFEAPDVAISKGMDDAVEFGPFLIVNGKSAEIKGNGGWGRAPRTVIAQRKDGVVLFLEIEGRLPGYSIGATMEEIIEVLLRYKAYNAANLDGGASATMAVNGKLYNRPSAGGEYGGRTVSNAWIVTNKQNKKAPTGTVKKQ